MRPQVVFAGIESLLGIETRNWWQLLAYVNSGGTLMAPLVPWRRMLNQPPHRSTPDGSKESPAQQPRVLGLILAGLSGAAGTIALVVLIHALGVGGG